MQCCFASGGASGKLQVPPYVGEARPQSLFSRAPSPKRNKSPEVVSASPRQARAYLSRLEGLVLVVGARLDDVVDLEDLSNELARKQELLLFADERVDNKLLLHVCGRPTMLLSDIW